MIKRINLIEKKAFSFTYLRLMQICSGVVTIIVALIAFQVFNAGRLEAGLKSAEKEIKDLEVKRDELLKQPTQTRVSVGQYQELLDHLENTPKWSRLMVELINRLPNTVWITSLKSSAGAAKVAATEEGSEDKKGKKSKSNRDKKDDKKAVAEAGKPSPSLFEMAGMSSDMRNVTEFTTNLSQSRIFKNLVLTESNKENYGFTFKIKSEIDNNVR